MGDWQKVGENLVRYRSGTIYLRAYVAGKIKRVSLKTEYLRIAKLKRDDMLDRLRKATKAHDGGKTRTLGDAIDTLSARTLARPDIKPATVGYYKEIFAILRQSIPVTSMVRSWTASDAAAWWKRIAEKYAAQRANNVLGMAKQLGKQMLAMGLRMDDPTTALRRVPITGQNHTIPSRAIIDQIIEDIRTQKKAHSKEASGFVAFLAYAGCRVGQARAFCWEHVQGDWLLFPAGVSGTKGAKVRRLPISPPLAAVLETLKPEKQPAKGPVFTMKRPHEALAGSCRRLKIEHLRIHDLRHFFATYALESGVDVPTVSKWLGHKDGGVLVLKTYSFLRDDHSLNQAAKLGSAPVPKPPEPP